MSNFFDPTKIFAMFQDPFRLVLILFLLLGLLLGLLTTRGRKSQWIRLADVFIYGPILILCGFLMPNKILAILLVLFGSSTITYNLYNYLAQQQTGEQ